MAKRTRPGTTARRGDAARKGNPAEESARVAERLSAPSPTSTRAGLPRRVPSAHLVPGAFSGSEQPSAPVRSAEDVRSRLDDYTDGVRRARQSPSD